jgi:hypothetical protein
MKRLDTYRHAVEELVVNGRVRMLSEVVETLTAHGFTVKQISDKAEKYLGVPRVVAAMTVHQVKNMH